MNTILDILPNKAEVVVGLALQQNDYYLFFLAGERHNCPPRELFYAGIGGHLEEGETLEECARREALEELGAEIKLISAQKCYYLRNSGYEKIVCNEQPSPLAVYEMIHPVGTPRAGQTYYIVIFHGRLISLPQKLKRDEVSGVIALSKELLIENLYN